MPKFTQRTITDNVVTGYTDVAVSKDGTVLLPGVTGTVDYRARKRDGSKVYQPGTKSVFGNGPILSAVINPALETDIYVANSANIFKGNLNLSTGALAGIAGAFITGPATRMAIDPTGTYIARANGTTLQIYDIATKTLRATFTLGGSVRDLEWSPDGVYLAAAPFLRIIKKTAANTFSNIGDISGSSLRGQAAVAWHPSGDHIAVCSDSSLTTRPGYTVYSRSGDVFTELAQSVFSDGGDPANQNYGDICYIYGGDYLVAGSNAGTPSIKAYERDGGSYELSAISGMTIENIDRIYAAANSRQVALITKATPFWKLYDVAIGGVYDATGYLMTGASRLELERLATVVESGFLMTSVISMKRSESLSYAGLGFLMTGGTALKRTEPAIVDGHGYLGQMFVYGGPTSEIIANGDMLPMSALIQLAGTVSATIAETGYLMAGATVATQISKLSASLQGYLAAASIALTSEVPLPPLPATGGIPGFSGQGSTISVGGGAVFFYGHKGITL